MYFSEADTKFVSQALATKPEVEISIMAARMNARPSYFSNQLTRDLVHHERRLALQYETQVIDRCSP